MIRKTDAIVLATQKFGDSSLICTLYTKLFGRKNFLIKGYRSTKAKSRHSYFQPMSIIEVVYFQKEGRELQLITDSHGRHFFKRLQTDPVRITLGIVVVDVFARAVREEERNDGLFGLLMLVLVSLDELDDKLIHVFIWYLVHLTRFLGFSPRTVSGLDADSPVFFDLREGVFESAPAVRPSDKLLLQFLGSDLEQAREFKFSQTDKREMIATLFQYYQCHVEGFKVPESLRVLEELF
jgi:DNA repair protein RecO (recombination protein O)